MKNIKDLRELQNTVKDLILFDSAWNKRNKIKSAKKLPKEALERLKTYRELVKNSLNSLITNIYRDTNKILHKDWNSLLSKYIEKYPPSSPILNRVCEHFPQFLKEEKSIMKKHPFISELALYEWLEIEIYERNGETAKRRDGDRFTLNPIHEICKFEYPVSIIIEQIKDNQKLGKVKKENTNIIIYRDPKTLTVRFIELSLGSVAYLELLKSGFPSEIIPTLLAGYYNIDEANLKSFNSEINKLIKTLRKSRIIL